MKVEREDALQAALVWTRLELAKSRSEIAQLQVQAQTSAWNQLQTALAIKYGQGTITAVDPDQGTIDFVPASVQAGTPPYIESGQAGTPPYKEEGPEVMD